MSTQAKMKIYTVSFEGHWPVGTYAIVVAADRGQAKRLLNLQLKAKGLGEVTAADFQLLDTSVAHADIISDGEY